MPVTIGWIVIRIRQYINSRLEQAKDRPHPLQRIRKSGIWLIQCSPDRTNFPAVLRYPVPRRQHTLTGRGAVGLYPEQRGFAQIQDRAIVRFASSGFFFPVQTSPCLTSHSCPAQQEADAPREMPPNTPVSCNYLYLFFLKQHNIPPPSPFP